MQIPQPGIRSLSSRVKRPTEGSPSLCLWHCRHPQDPTLFFASTKYNEARNSCPTKIYLYFFLDYVVCSEGREMASLKENNSFVDIVGERMGVKGGMFLPCWEVWAADLSPHPPGGCRLKLRGNKEEICSCIFTGKMSGLISEPTPETCCILSLLGGRGLPRSYNWTNCPQWATKTSCFVLETSASID